MKWQWSLLSLVLLVPAAVAEEPLVQDPLKAAPAPAAPAPIFSPTTGRPEAPAVAWTAPTTSIASSDS